MLRNVIIEGVDRLGKGTLIEGLLQQLGYFQVIHYEKPQLLERLVTEQLWLPKPASLDQITLEEAERLNKRDALREYQAKSFATMFTVLSTRARFIMDRAHLGETVYAPRYRGYSGEYVFDIERMFKEMGHDFAESTLLVLLTTSDWSFVQDDGKSFDVSQREEEQADFVRAFNRSIIQHKINVDVNAGGKFRSKREILEAVVGAFER